MADLVAKSETRIMKFRHDTLTVQCFLPKNSWNVLSKIDQLIAEALALSGEEGDYLINYDIKYRMGQSIDDVDD